MLSGLTDIDSTLNTLETEHFLQHIISVFPEIIRINRQLGVYSNAIIPFLRKVVQIGRDDKPQFHAA